MKNKPIYKLMDSKGRVLIPKELRTASGMTELIRSKLNVDRLMLRQQQGFQCVMPSGFNVFRDQFERVLPASSVANLYPFNYSGKTDANGFYVGRDKFGSNVLVDFNKRADDKTNANILILGNSGQGKSYLLKLILCNLRESGMNITALDPEMEYEDLTNNLGGCFIDLMNASDYRAFAECFVRYEERTRTVTNADGNETEEIYTVAVPITDLNEIYANLESSLGRTITEENKVNAAQIYSRVLYGHGLPRDGSIGEDEWSGGVFDGEIYTGGGDFASPLGVNWRSMGCFTYW